MLSKSAEYALRALHCLAFLPDGDPVPAARLAERVGVPENYLSKLLHRLQQEGVVSSQRGRGGGFRLARGRDAIALADVVRPFDAGFLSRRCLLGRPECRDDAPCAAHEEWLEVAGRMRRFFRETTLGDLGPPAPSPGEGPACGGARAAPAAAVERAGTGDEGARAGAGGGRPPARPEADQRREDRR